MSLHREIKGAGVSGSSVSSSLSQTRGSTGYSFLPIEVLSRTSTSVLFSFKSPLTEAASCRLLHNGQLVQSKHVDHSKWEHASFENLRADNDYTLFCGYSSSFEQLPPDFNGAAGSVFIPAVETPRGSMMGVILVGISLVVVAVGFVVLRKTNLWSKWFNSE